MDVLARSRRSATRAPLVVVTVATAVATVVLTLLPAGAIPLYSNVDGVLSLVGALYDKGLPMGTLLAFMMAVVALSPRLGTGAERGGGS